MPLPALLDFDRAMDKLVDGDDGLPVSEVGAWAKDKIETLCRYVDISSAVRAKWLGPRGGGATYVELFCGPGRSKIRRKPEFIEGSCVAAWLASRKGKAPFSKIYIADADDERREYAVERLKRLNAPVVGVPGNAVTAAGKIRKMLMGNGLNFVFIDPYSLGAFDFSVIEAFAGFRYIDILVHISKMDLQRNTKMNVTAQRKEFDSFAPGWKSVVDITQNHSAVRRDVIEFWREKVEALKISASANMQLIKGDGGQHLYWLTLIARHELALKFWKTASNKSRQYGMFD